MSLKGKVFTEADLPQNHKLRGARAGELKPHLDAMTERYRIVAFDGDYPVIAEELVERIMRRVPEDVRPLVRSINMLPDYRRKRILEMFDADTGELKNMLTKV